MAIRLGKEATFKGESFSDMIAPLKEYATAYKEVEANYDTLAMETEKLQQMMKQEDPNSRAFQTYNDYYNRLNATVTDFAKGMNMRNRSALSGMKRGYAQNIVPINNALTLKKSLVDAQDKARAADKSTIFRKDASTYSIDDLIANPTQGVGDMISGQDIYKNVQDMASNLAKELYKGNPEMMKLFPYTYRLKDRYGWNSDQVLKAILNKDNPDNALNYLVNQAVNATGVQNWKDNQGAYQKALEWAAMGAWDAIGETKPTQVYDQYNAALALQEAKANSARKAAGEAQKKTFMQNIHRYNIYTTEQNNALENLHEWLEKGYIEKGDDGRWNVTQSGEKYFASKAAGGLTSQDNIHAGATIRVTHLAPNIKSVLERDNEGRYDINKYISDHGLDPADLDENADSADWWDTRRWSGWMVTIDHESQDDVKKTITNALGNNYAYEAVFKDGKYKRDETTDILKDKDSQITGIKLSPYGHVLIVQDKNGDNHELSMERYMNVDLMPQIDNLMQNIVESQNEYGSHEMNLKEQDKTILQALGLPATGTVKETMDADGKMHYSINGQPVADALAEKYRYLFDIRRQTAEQNFNNSKLTAFDSLMRSFSPSQTSPVKYPAGQEDQDFWDYGYEYPF